MALTSIVVGKASKVNTQGRGIVFNGLSVTNLFRRLSPLPKGHDESRKRGQKGGDTRREEERRGLPLEREDQAADPRADDRAYPADAEGPAYTR